MKTVTIVSTVMRRRIATLAVIEFSLEDKADPMTKLRRAGSKPTTDVPSGTTPAGT